MRFRPTTVLLAALMVPGVLARADDFAAVIVGIDDYTHQEKLTTSRHDAKALADVLLLRAGYNPTRVVVLTDDAKDYHKRPTRIMIRENIERICETAREGDTVLIYFSGHSRLVDGEVVLVALSGDDRGEVSLEWLKDRLVGSPASRKILILDTGHDKAPTQGFGKVAAVVFGETDRFVTLLSAGPGQRSHADETGVRSVFSRHFVEGLSGKADADADRIVTLAELHTYVNRETITWSGKTGKAQAPVILGRQRSTKDFTLTRKLTDTARRPAAERRDRAYDLCTRGVRAKDPAEKMRLYREAMRIDPAWSVPYSNIAWEHFAKGEYDEAIHWATTAIKLDDTDGHAYITRGRAYRSKGEEVLCMRDMNSLVALHPNCDKCILSRRYYSARAHALLHFKKYDQALEDFNRAIKYSMKGSRYYPALAHAERAYAYRTMGKFDLAIADYDRAVQMYPRCKGAYTGRGLTWQEKGDHTRAIQDFTSAIQNDPNDRPAYSNRGYSFFMKGDHKRALADYEKAIALEPGRAIDHANCAANAARLGQYDRAVAFATRAIDLDPKTGLAYLERGKALARLRRYDGAIADLRKTATLLPTSTGFFWLGHCHKAKRQLDASIESYTRGISLEPDSRNLHFMRGDAYHMKGNLDRALADYTRAIQLHGTQQDGFNVARIWCARGEVYVARRQYDRALAQFTGATELNPSFPKAHNNRAFALNKLGKYDRAIEAAGRAVALDPKYPWPYSHRGWAKFKKGDLDGALEDLDKSIQLDPKYARSLERRADVHLAMKNYDKAWADVKRCRELGGKVTKEFLDRLKKASGRTE